MQGTAADIMKTAMIAVDEEFDKHYHRNPERSGSEVEGWPRILLQIHDSLIVECPEKQAEPVGKILKETMENIYKLPVKLTVDISIGKNWGEL